MASIVNQSRARSGRLCCLYLLVCAVAVFAASPVGVVIAIIVDSPPRNPSDYNPWLAARAADALPIIDALTEHHRSQGRFAAEAAELAPRLGRNMRAASDGKSISGWHYWPREDFRAYSLTKKLGWDESLKYEFSGDKGQWIFCPGDGTDDIPLELFR